MLNDCLHQFMLSAPLFLLVLVGYLLIRVGGWSLSVSKGMSKFVFNVAVPALLFNTMRKFSQLPPVDARLLIAFFGSCFIVFAIGRLLAWKMFRLDGLAQSIFAMGGIYSNNVFLGIPIAKVALGDQALPPVALVIAFNALILWTLATISTEWAQHGSLSLKGFGKTAKSVLTNPIVASLLLGLAFDYSGLPMPKLIGSPIDMLDRSATPMALIVLGMGLAEYGISAGWQQSLTITWLKLILQPLVVWGLAVLIGLPKMETQAIVMLASISVGINVYLMAEQFKTMEGAIASSLLLSTIFSAIVTPIAIALTA